MPTLTDRRRAGFANGIALAILIGFLVSMLAVPSSALAAPARELRASVAERFEVLPLRSGVVLRPRHEADYKVVEFSGTGVLVDGDALSEADLRSRLASDYDLVSELRRLTPTDRRELLHAATAADAVESVPQALSVPPAPAAPAAPSLPSAPSAPTAPSAPVAPRLPRRHSDAKLAFGSTNHVEKGEVADDVVSFGGSVKVDGEVIGDAVAIGGSVGVNGRVTGDVVAVGGSVDLGPEAEVLGQVTAVGGHVDRDPAARVVGKTSEVALGPALRAGLLRDMGRSRRWNWRGDDDIFAPVSWMAGTVRRGIGLTVLALLLCLVVLVARGPLERVEQKVTEDAWRAGLVGLAAQVLFFPLLLLTIVVLAVSIIGIPLLVLVPFAVLALVLGGFLGFAAVATRLGRWAEHRFGWRFENPYLVALVGLAIIEVCTFSGHLLDLGFGPFGCLSGLIVLAGFLVQYVAWTVGFGAALQTRFGTVPSWTGWRMGRGRPLADASIYGPTPVEPMAPMAPVAPTVAPSAPAPAPEPPAQSSPAGDAPPAVNPEAGSTGSDTSTPK